MGRKLINILLIMAVCVGVVGAGAVFTGCMGTQKNGNGSDISGVEGRIRIVATLFPQYDFARQIAGEYADVVLLLPPGMESHSYDLRPADMITIRESDMFIYTGEYMEAWAQTIIDSLDESVRVVDASQGITLEREADYFVEEHDHEDEDAYEHEEDDVHDHEHEEDDVHDHEHEEDDVHDHGDEYSPAHSGHHHEYDPHIWTNPVYAMQMVRNIVEALCIEDPEHADIYEARAEEYIAGLAGLDAAFREVSAHVAHNTIFFGGRFAMSYFVREYGFDCVAAYHDCSAESEPSISSVMKMIDEIRESGARAVYYEELTDPKVAGTIAEETGAKLLLLHSAHNVSKEDFDSGVTYLDIMWNNVENLKEGLE